MEYLDEVDGDKKAKVKNIDKVTCVEGIYLDQRKDEWKVTVKEDNIISF